MKNLPDDLKPREKALQFGLKSLTDQELMAIIFGTGIHGKDVMQLCSEILDANRGSLADVAALTARQFMDRHKGIGPAKALTLLAGLELGVRAAAEAVRQEKPAMTSPKLAYEYMRGHFAGLDHEQFWVLLLKQNLKPLREFMVGQGGLNATAVDVKIIIREALLSNAPAMMLFHNHPSGNLRPSIQDINLTKRIKEAAALFDIRVVDHLIATTADFFSLHDNGQM